MTNDANAVDSEEERGDAEPSDGDGEESEDAALAELAALREHAAANHDRYLRAVAELENVRKRAARDVENARRYGFERLAKALLPVIDSLGAGLASSEQASAESLLDGKKATMRLLNSALEQVGIKELDPHGEPFDPALHEAMAVAPSDEAEPGTVLEVFQKGYSIHDRLLRAARVVVAGEPAENGG
ncbi:MAG: nucleotide exchange factor GrpE [Rhodospirillaceae bacterium]|nr:nucleotide exchange factor GrpE [Rhodospirillaceae bacterium]MDE0361187.1 nucleotide exchange factor GrpE [Rhodospirillaceae bacterium]